MQQDDDDSYDHMTLYIAEAIKSVGQRVPVITGFFGQMRDSLLDGPIGRGYTDVCAALCAVALGAEELQIWKEVSGIMTADPNLVPAAKCVMTMSLTDAAALTRNGSEVVHATAMQLFQEKAHSRMTLRIKDVRAPREPGTSIHSGDAFGGMQRSRFIPTLDMQTTLCAAITTKSKCCLLHVRENKDVSSAMLLGVVSDLLEVHSITAQMVATSTKGNLATLCLVHDDCLRFIKACKTTHACCTPLFIPDLTAITLVGVEVVNMFTVTKRLVSTLHRAAIFCEAVFQRKCIPSHHSSWKRTNI